MSSYLHKCKNCQWYIWNLLEEIHHAVYFLLSTVVTIFHQGVCPEEQDPLGTVSHDSSS